MQKGKMKEYTLFSRNLGIVLDIQNRKKCKEAIYDCDTALSIENAQELLPKRAKHFWDGIDLMTQEIVTNRCVHLEKMLHLVSQTI